MGWDTSSNAPRIHFRRREKLRACSSNRGARDDSFNGCVMQSRSHHGTRSGQHRCGGSYGHFLWGRSNRVQLAKERPEGPRPKRRYRGRLRRSVSAASNSVERTLSCSDRRKLHAGPMATGCACRRRSCCGCACPTSCSTSRPRISIRSVRRRCVGCRSSGSWRNCRRGSRLRVERLHRMGKRKHNTKRRAHSVFSSSLADVRQLWRRSNEFVSGVIARLSVVHEQATGESKTCHGHPLALPASIVIRRSHRDAIPWSCVTSTSVVPCSRLSANISSITVSPVA